MKRRYFTIAAAAITFAACTDDLGLGDFANDPNAVRIEATVGETLTRSNPVGDATTVKQFNEGDKIFVSTDAQPNGIVYQLGSEGWKPEGTEYLTWSNTKHSFKAYYPDTFKGSGDVPADQGDIDKIATADYMKFEGDLEMQNPVSFTMSRQTARVIINKEFSWGDVYMKEGTSTHKVDAIQVNCMGVSDIKPYQPDNYYALVNPGSADSDATFLTITVSPIEGEDASVTHIVKGIPEFEPGYSYTYNLTIGKSGVTISDVTVEDWSTGNILSGEGSADDNLTGNHYLYVAKPEEAFSSVGGSKDYTVRSFITNGEGVRIAIPWTAKFVRKLDDGTYEEIKQGDTDYPDWIINFVDKGIGEVPDQVCPITVEAAVTSNNHYYTLKKNTPVSGIYNLSNTTGGETVENTANCYIINAPGTYSFPLVYGNAIKNGVNNQSAYISTATGENALEKFVNHNNAPITSPYIAAHGDCTPTNATLVWQDAENLVSNIQFVDGGSPETHRITFEVAEWSIKQGNAIIAIRDDKNTILWSWHIWVTDYKPLQAASVMSSYDPTETQKDKEVWTYDNSTSFTFMGVPLGWCDAESSAGREAIIQYTQLESGNTYEVTIKQEPLSAGGNCTFYQWGRKDPMLPGNGLEDKDKPHYGEYEFTKGVQGKVAIGTAIQNPHIVYDRGTSGYADWCSGAATVEGKSIYLRNLWDINNVTTQTDKNEKGIKTVYDPSPVGYVVPPSGAFSGFTFDGTNQGEGWSYKNKFNIPQDLSPEQLQNMGGWLFYCKGMGGTAGNFNTNGGVIYIPAVGARNCSNDVKGKLYDVGIRGNMWANNIRLDGEARVFEFANDRVVVISNNFSLGNAQSMPVRPIREQ